MDKWLPEEGQLFRKLYEQYAAEHSRNDQDHISETPWSYATYHSGELIAREVREAYRENYDIMFLYEDPFEKSNKIYRELLGIGSDGKTRKPSRFKRRWRKAWSILTTKGIRELVNAFLQWVKK